MAKKSSKPKNKVITAEQFGKWSPEHQARALADKRIRQRIETKALPAEWKAKREKAAWNKTEISPGSGVTYGDVEKSRKYTENLTFGEGDRQLADRYTNLSEARGRDADWFRAYREQVQQAQGRAVAAQDAAVQGNKAFLDSVNRVSDSSRDQVAQQLRDRASQLGMAPRDAEANRLADAAAQSLNVGFANAAQRQLGGAQANVQLATGGVDLANVKDLEAQGYRNKQQANLEKDTRDYVSKRASWREKFLEDAIASARKAVLEDKAFNLKTSELKLKGKQAEAQNALAQARLDIQKGNLKIAAARLGLSQQELQAKIAAGYFNKSKSSKTDKPYKGTPWKNPDPQKRFDHGLAWLKTQRVAGGKLILTPDKLRKGGPVYGGASFWIDKLQTQGLSPKLAHRVVYSFIHGYSGSFRNAPKRYEG